MSDSPNATESPASLFSSLPLRFRLGALGVIIVLCAIAALIIATRPASISGWSSIDIPGPNEVSLFTGVSCVNPDTCMLVGQDAEGFLNATITGSTAVPAEPGDLGETNSVFAVQCFPTAHCIGVGSTGSGIAVSTMIDGAWTAEPVATDLPGSGLFGVSCPTQSWCMAVGSGPTGPVADVIRGSSITSMDTGLVSSPGTGFDAVSCLTKSYCLGVGYTPAGTWAVAWNGSHWRTIQSPSPTSESTLEDVACAGSGDCFAVGTTGTKAILAQWNGSSWSFQTQRVQTIANLSGLSCASSSSCVAVGGACSSKCTTVAAHDIPISYTWNGHLWAALPRPNEPGYFQSVSCRTQTACLAVGASGTDDILAEVGS